MPRSRIRDYSKQLPCRLAQLNVPRCGLGVNQSGAIPLDLATSVIGMSHALSRHCPDEIEVAGERVPIYDVIS